MVRENEYSHEMNLSILVLQLNKRFITNETDHWELNRYRDGEHLAP